MTRPQAKLISGELHVFEAPLSGYNPFDESKTVTELVPAGGFYPQSSEAGLRSTFSGIIEGIIET